MWLEGQNAGAGLVRGYQPQCLTSLLTSAGHSSLVCRLNGSLSAHPEKDELILFGGEYFNGQKVTYTSIFFLLYSALPLPYTAICMSLI